MESKSLQERKRENSKNYYNNKIRENQEFYANEKERIKLYKKNRYKNDPDFAEILKQRSRDTYKKRKEKTSSVSN